MLNKKFKIIFKYNTNVLLIPTVFTFKIIKNIKQEYFFVCKNENSLIVLKFKNLLYFDECTNCIINQTNINYILNLFFKKDINYLVYLALKSLNLISQIKIVFKGKSYKIRKSTTHKNCVELDFHKAHKSLYLFKNIFIKKLRKQKLLLASYNFFFVKKISGDIVNIRRFNFYTRRGIRFKSQFTPRRSSKKSLKKR